MTWHLVFAALFIATGCDRLLFMSPSPSKRCDLIAMNATLLLSHKQFLMEVRRGGTEPCLKTFRFCGACGRLAKLKTIFAKEGVTADSSPTVSPTVSPAVSPTLPDEVTADSSPTVSPAISPTLPDEDRDVKVKVFKKY